MKQLLKAFFLLVILFSFAEVSNAQGLTYYSNTSGDAADLANWDDVGDGSGTNPPTFAEGDLFIITNGHDMTVSSTNWNVDAPDGICGIQIEESGSLTVSATFNISIPPDGSFILDGSYIHNSTVVMDRDIFDNPSINAGSTITVGADQTWNSLYPNLTFANLIVNTGVTITSQRQISLDGTLTLSGTSILRMTSNVSLVNVSGFTSQLGTGTFRTVGTSGAAIPSGVTWAGTVELNASATSSQTIASGTYTNIIARTTTGAGSNIFSSTGTVSISGTITAGTGTYTTTGSTVDYNGSGAQSLPANITTYNNLTISNAGTKTMNGNVQANGTLTIGHASGILAINGNTLTMQGSSSMTGALAGSSTSNLTISGTTGGSPTVNFNPAATDSLLNNFTLNRTGASAGVTLGTNVALINLLTITNGVFSMNGKIVTLKSSSIANTAQIAEVAGSISYTGGGSFTTERFIPQGNRSYRDFAVGVNTASGVNFFHTWQENAGSTAGLGIHITGLVGVSPGGNDATTGLDLTGTGAKSVFTYTNGVWSTGVTNTKTTKPDIYQGYRTFVRGDRNVNLYITQSSMNVATKLRANGTPITGTVTYTTSGITNSGGPSTSVTLNTTTTAGSFSLLANPYLCAIDWSLVGRTNLTSSYTTMDPTLGANGAYVTCNTAGVNSNPSSNVNQYIQSGQAFFVEANGGGSPQLVISETNKNTSNKTAIFRSSNVINKLGFGLSKSISGQGIRNVDGCTVVFDADGSNGIDTSDASKLTNGNENISLLTESLNLAIETKAIPKNADTIHLKMWQMVNNTSYTLTVFGGDFNTSIPAYIYDAYTNTERLVKIGDTTNITFTALTANTSTFANRFKIVFRGSAALPLSTINLQAIEKNGGVEVNWQTSNEVDLKNYEVEQSQDGKNFDKQATVTAKNESSNSYSTFNANIKNGIWYFRIKIIQKDGSFKYSNTVTINLNTKNSELVVFPNPVKGKVFTVQFAVAEKGNYTIQLFNQSGQVVLNKFITLQTSTNASVIVDCKQQQVPVGNYSLMITNEFGMKLTKQIIVAD